MSLRDEIHALRRHLEQLSSEAETDLVERYALRIPPAVRTNPYRRLRMLAGKVLREMGLRHVRPPEPWSPGLRQMPGDDHARAFLVWAPGADRETLRAACRGIEAVHASLPDRVPVLITDVADFAFFSRLGWLVEYVPRLSAPAAGFAARKWRYLAWRYRHVPAIPLSAGLKKNVQPGELMID